MIILAGVLAALLSGVIVAAVLILKSAQRDALASLQSVSEDALSRLQAAEDARRDEVASLLNRIVDPMTETAREQIRADIELMDEDTGPAKKLYANESSEMTLGEATDRLARDHGIQINSEDN